MEQFSLEKWLQDKSRKVVTRDGREVEIVKYDIKGTHFPVLYVISNEDGSQEPCECSKSGMCQFDNTKSSTDLFFADEEEELTEFEKELQIIINEASHWTSDDGSISTCCSYGDKDIQKISEKILELARKEILKDLPKWKKAEKDEELDCHVAIQQDGRVVLSDFVQKDEYYITLDVLKTLPKEE